MEGALRGSDEQMKNESVLPAAISEAERHADWVECDSPHRHRNDRPVLRAVALDGEVLRRERGEV